jgi:uncharacterized membrane protein
MDILLVLFAGYIATTIMLFMRTYFICVRMIREYKPDSIIIQYRTLHAIIFALGILIITIPIVRVVFNDNVRKRFCIGYVNSVMEK